MSSVNKDLAVLMVGIIRSSDSLVLLLRKSLHKLFISHSIPCLDIADYGI